MAQPTPETIVIDQNGDAIITLRKPGFAFAIWEPEQEEPNQHDTTTMYGERKGKEKQLVDDLQSPLGDFVAPKKKLSIKSKKMRMREKERKRRAAEDWSNVTVNGNEDSLAGYDGVTDTQPEMEDERKESASPQLEHETAEITEPTVTYLVSSKHLVTACGKFRSELTGSWSESAKGEDGLYYLTAEEWDPEVFTIMLNILHLRNRKVPDILSLDELAKLAVLVDYYRCWEAVETWTNKWIERVRKAEPVPALYSRDLILWMLIAWVFGLDQEFETTTAIALRHSQTPVIRDMGLSIPVPVIEAMERRRYEALDAIMSRCHDLIEEYRDTYECPSGKQHSFACGSILFGALTKEMHRLGYLSSKPEIPFAGLSFEKLCENIKGVQSPQWYSEAGHHDRFYHNSSTSRHTCNLQSTLGPHIDLMKKSTQGLKIQDFVDHAKELENDGW